MSVKWSSERERERERGNVANIISVDSDIETLLSNIRHPQA